MKQKTEGWTKAKSLTIPTVSRSGANPESAWGLQRVGASADPVTQARHPPRQSSAHRWLDASLLFHSLGHCAGSPSGAGAVPVGWEACPGQQPAVGWNRPGTLGCNPRSKQRLEQGGAWWFRVQRKGYGGWG